MKAFTEKSLARRLSILNRRLATENRKAKARAKAGGYTHIPRTHATALPYRSRLKVFKSSSGKNKFDPFTISATSYRHWEYVRLIRGKVVFNNYRYSVTTGGHQGDMLRLLKQLGIKIDLEVSIRASLSAFERLALAPMYDRIFLLEIKIGRKGTPKERAAEYRAEIKTVRAQIQAARKIGARCVKFDRKLIKANVIRSESERLERDRAKRADTAADRRAAKALMNAELNDDAIELESVTQA